ncbi:MAG: conjugal transfer protein TraF [Gammaproteobacteria bacterium]|nr:conjugal transfer protein TraF [Gammaproteobacteria bacterium]
MKKMTFGRLNACYRWIILMSLAVCFPGLALAGQGPTQTLGHAVNPITSLYSTLNPAANSLLLADDTHYRWGYLSNVGLSVELGEVDNLMEEIDELADELERDELTFDEANRIITKFDSLLKLMGEEGYISTHANAEVPLMPLLFKIKKLGGTFSFNAALDASSGAYVLDAPLTYNAIEEELETATSLYIKSGLSQALSLGYSRHLFDLESSQVPSLSGLVFGGARLTAYRMELSKQVVALDSLDDDDVGDAIADSYDENTKTTSNIGLDLGLIYRGKNIQAGATLYNLNEPEFDYGPVGISCSQYPDNSAKRRNCVAAQYFAASGEINSKETYTLSAQLTLDTAVQTEDRHWQLASSLDTNAVYDAVGNERQLFNLSASYFSNSHWLPSIRLGYSKNLAGSELSMLHGGLTLFGGTHIDFAYGLETVEIDGDKAPRSFGFSFGFERAF